MTLQDKLYQLRKQRGMSQLELAEALNVSRQAISKWELGTAIPTIENFLAISKLYGVSVDYLVNDDMTSELDAPVVKVTAAYYRLNYKMILIRVIIICIAIIAAVVAGFATKSLATAVLSILVVGAGALLFYVLRWLTRFFANKSGS